jgi:hypothetical protein
LSLLIFFNAKRQKYCRKDQSIPKNKNGIKKTFVLHGPFENEKKNINWDTPTHKLQGDLLILLSKIKGDDNLYKVPKLDWVGDSQTDEQIHADTQTLTDTTQSSS